MKIETLNYYLHRQNINKDSKLKFIYDKKLMMNFLIIYCAWKIM